MAKFWGRDADESKIPEKLKGLSAEQLLERIEKAESLEKDTTDLKAALAAKDAVITEHSTTLATMREQMQRLEANQKPVEKAKPEDDIDFLSDPEGSVKQQISRSVTPVVAAVLQGNAQLARNSAVQTLQRQRFQGTKLSKGAVFEKYSGEIDKLAKNTNISALQSPDAWIHLFNMVVGQKMDEILPAARDGKFESLFVESSVDDTDRRMEGGDKQDQPTATEIDIAKRMKIPIEKYMENKKAMVTA